MKRAICRVMAIILLITCSLVHAESVDSYDQYLSEMLEAFSYRDYTRVVGLYEEICAKWPDPLDRSGGADSYAQYAEGRLAMEEHNYSAAIRKFGSLGPFPSADEPLNGIRLMTYCEGMQFLLHGLWDEALEQFLLCDGILDTPQLIEKLQQGKQDTIHKFSAFSCGSTTADLSWIDINADETDNYYITYMPKGVERYEKTAQAAVQAVTLSDLIPGTTYVAYLMPVSGSIPTGQSVETEFTTAEPRRPDSVIRIQSAQLYGYSKVARQNYLSRLKRENDTEAFLKAIDNLLEKGGVWVQADTIPLSISEIAFSETGYIFSCMWKKQSSASPTIRAVCRSEKGDNNNLVYFLDVPATYKATFGSTRFYMDDLLDEIYSNQHGWPYDTDLIFELYDGDTRIYMTSYHMIAE